MAGAIIGGINGFVIAKLKINALITTLATMEIVRGLAFIASHGQAVGVSDMDFFDLGNTIFFGVPTPVWVAALCFVVFGVLLNKTIYGRNTLAIGGNPEAARNRESRPSAPMTRAARISVTPSPVVACTPRI